MAVRLRLWSRDVCFVNSHLAAHTDGVPKRNDDWRRIYDGMFSGRASQGPPGAKGEAQPLASVAKAAGGTYSYSATPPTPPMAAGGTYSYSYSATPRPSPWPEYPSFHQS